MLYCRIAQLCQKCCRRIGHGGQPSSYPCSSTVLAMSSYSDSSRSNLLCPQTWWKSNATYLHEGVPDSGTHEDCTTGNPTGSKVCEGDSHVAAGYLWNCNWIRASGSAQRLWKILQGVLGMRLLLLGIDGVHCLSVCAANLELTTLLRTLTRAHSKGERMSDAKHAAASTGVLHSLSHL